MVRHCRRRSNAGFLQPSPRKNTSGSENFLFAAFILLFYLLKVHPLREHRLLGTVVEVIIRLDRGCQIGVDISGLPFLGRLWMPIKTRSSSSPVANMPCGHIQSK